MAAVDLSIRLEGAEQAEAALDGVRKAADQAADATERVAAPNTKAGFNGTAEAAKSLGASFDETNDRVAKLGGRFGDIRSRLGEVEDAFKVLSGFALVELGTALVDAATTLYGWTEAGKQAARETKGLEDALQSLGTQFGETAAAIDPAAYIRLADATGKANAALEAYNAAIKIQTETQKEIRETQEEIAKLAAAGETSGYTWNRLNRNLGILQRTLEQGTIRAEKLREEYLQGEADAEKLRKEQERLAGASQRLVDGFAAQARSAALAAGAYLSYRLEVAAGKGPIDDTIGVFAEIAALGVKVADGVAEASKSWDKAGKSARDATPAIVRFTDALLASQDPLRALIDGLPATGTTFAEATGAIDEMAVGLNTAVDNMDKWTEADREAREQQLERMAETAKAISLDERMVAAQGANRESTLDLLKAKQALEIQQARLNGESDEYIRKLEEVHTAELKAASGSDLAGFGAAGAAIQSVTDALDSKGAAAWSKWASAAASAIEYVQGILNTVSFAINTVTEANLVPLRNELTRLEEQLASASALEAQAEAEKKAAKGTADQAAANEKVAATAKKRAAAEQAVYKAKLDLIKAEEEAAETQKKLKVLEFTLQGAFAAAKAIEMAGVAADRFASYQYVAGAAAVAAGVSYAAAAAAYGVAAHATAKAPVARQQRPQDPAELDRSTARAGDRDRRSEQPPVINLSFSGGALHTKTEVQDTIVEAWNAAQQRRGGARAQGR